MCNVPDTKYMTTTTKPETNKKISALTGNCVTNISVTCVIGADGNTPSQESTDAAVLESFVRVQQSSWDRTCFSYAAVPTVEEIRFNLEKLGETPEIFVRELLKRLKEMDQELSFLEKTTF